MTCPVDNEFDPFDDAYLRDPHPPLRELRERSPVCYSPRFDLWVVTRYDDVRGVFGDAETFGASLVHNPLFPMDPEALAVLRKGCRVLPATDNCDDRDLHRRVRGRLTKLFTSGRMAALEPEVRKRATRLVDELDGTTDMVSRFALPFASGTALSFFGVPEADHADVLRWSHNRTTVDWGLPTPAEEVESAHGIVALWEYCESWATDRRADVPAELDGLATRELASVLFALCMAGFDSTTALITNCLRALLGRRELWEALCADAAMIPHAIEETLRYEPVILTWRRIARRDTEIGGVPIPRGAKILLQLASAQRDPAAFDEPDRFDLARSNARIHLNFGRGVHACAGAPLARLEATVALQELTTRLPGLRLVPGQEPVFPASIALRHPRELLVELGPGAYVPGAPTTDAAPHD